MLQQNCEDSLIQFDLSGRVANKIRAMIVRLGHWVDQASVPKPCPTTT